MNEAHALARRRARCLALKFCSAEHRYYCEMRLKRVRAQAPRQNWNARYTCPKRR